MPIDEREYAQPPGSGPERTDQSVQEAESVWDSNDAAGGKGASILARLAHHERFDWVYVSFPAAIVLGFVLVASFLDVPLVGGSDWAWLDDWRPSLAVSLMTAAAVVFAFSVRRDRSRQLRRLELLKIKQEAKAIEQALADEEVKFGESPK